MLVFDTPIPLGPVGRRNQSNVPAQPLALLNDPFVIEQARLWAKKILASHGDSPETIITGFYLDAFARAPTKEELRAANDFMNQLGAERGPEAGPWEKDVNLWADYAHVLINTKEFIFLP